MGIVRGPLQGIFDHGEEELAKANAILELHEPTPQRMCTCGRPWSCSVADFAAEYAAYWEYRLEMERNALRRAIESQTIQLPILR